MSDVVVISEDRGEYVFERVEHRDAANKLIATSDRATFKAGTVPANREDLRGKARLALAVNAAFLAIASPSNAQVLTQVQRLTREVTALIKLDLEDLADTSGT